MVRRKGLDALFRLRCILQQFLKLLLLSVCVFAHSLQCQGLSKHHYAERLPANAQSLAWQSKSATFGVDWRNSLTSFGGMEAWIYKGVTILLPTCKVHKYRHNSTRDIAELYIITWHQPRGSAKMWGFITTVTQYLLSILIFLQRIVRKIWSKLSSLTKNSGRILCKTIK